MHTRQSPNQWNNQLTFIYFPAQWWVVDHQLLGSIRVVLVQWGGQVPLPKAWQQRRDQLPTALLATGHLPDNQSSLPYTRIPRQKNAWAALHATKVCPKRGQRQLTGPTLIAALTAAPEDTPTKTPSSVASRLAMVLASWVFTVTTSSTTAGSKVGGCSPADKCCTQSSSSRAVRSLAQIPSL